MLKFLYRTILPVCVVAVMFGFGAVKAHAVSNAELQAQIAQLMAIVSQLQGQLGGGGSNLTIAPESQCPVPRIDNNLKFGDRDSNTNGEVSRLQKFLVQKYKLNRADYVTGYFGRGTQGLVSRFEADNGLSVTGWANETTLGKIAKECNKDGEGLIDQADVNIEETSFAYYNGGFTVDGTADFMQGRTLIVFASTYNYNAPSLETMDGQVLKGVLKSSVIVSEKGRWSTTFKTAQYRDKETYYIYVYDAATRTLMSTFTKSIVKTANGDASCTITSDKSVVVPGETFTIKWKTKGMSNVVMYQEVKGGGTVAVSKKGSMKWTAERDGGFTDVFNIGQGGISAPTNPICEVGVKVVSEGQTSSPTITTVLPKNNSGAFEVGDTIPMKWEYTNIPANSQIIAKLELVSSSGTGSLSGGTWQSSQISGSGSFTYPSGGWRTGSNRLDVPGTYRLYTTVRQCGDAGCSYYYPSYESLPVSASGIPLEFYIHPKEEV